MDYLGVWGLSMGAFIAMDTRYRGAAPHRTHVHRHTHHAPSVTVRQQESR